MDATDQGEGAKLSQVIQIDEGKIQEHLGEVVRSTVEETLNAMLDAEADRLCRAAGPRSTNERKRGKIPGRDPTKGICRRRRAK